MGGGEVVVVYAKLNLSAKPTMGLFRSLDGLLHTYPTPLRESLLEHLDRLVEETLPGDPEALKLRARLLIPADMEENEEFVERLRKGNGILLSQARTQRGVVSRAYAEVIGEWCERDLDPNIVGLLWIV